MKKESVLDKQLQMLETFSSGVLGLSAIHIETGEQINYKSDQKFLMCSTYKLPMAIYMLHLAEKKQLDLDELYFLREVDKRPGAASAFNDLACQKPAPISYRNLLLMMLRESCNTSTDIILRKIGGPAAVNHYIHQLGINEMSVDNYTLEIIAASDGVKKLPDNHECTLEDYKRLSAEVTKEELAIAKKLFINDERNNSTPEAMTALLKLFFQKEILNEVNTQWLLQTMRRNKLYPNRLMGLLPAKTPVAHKTGTAEGYTNDVGIISLPHGQGHVAITVFIKESSKERSLVERALAEVSRTIYDYFLYF